MIASWVNDRRTAGCAPVECQELNTGTKIMLTCEPRRRSVLKIIFIGVEGSGYARVFRSF